MEDMGITPEQFEHACTVNRDTKIPIHFQQVWPLRTHTHTLA